MATIREAFEYASKNPNSQTAKDLASMASSGALDIEAKANGIDLTPFKPKPVAIEDKPRAELTSEEKAQRDTKNAAKFIGLDPIAEGLGQAFANKKINKQNDQAQNESMRIQGDLIAHIKEKKAKGEDTSHLDKALSDLNTEISQQGADRSKLLNQEDLTTKQVLGSAAQTAANFLPGAAKGAGLVKKVLIGAGTGYAYDVGSNLQNKDKTVKEAFKPGIATVVGGSLPIASAVIKNVVAPVVKRLTKGLASGLSGVGTESLDSIISNPEKAQQFTKELQSKGNQAVLKEQSQTIMNGVSKIRKEASTAYGEGLERLSKTDIKPKVFREKMTDALSEFGITRDGEHRVFSNVEFDDPKNLQKASDLIDKLSNAELDGKSLRKLMNDLDNSIYKTATSDERIAFNRFVQDLSGSIRSAISASTPKLDEINAKYAQDLGLTDAVEGIFGKVKFKNVEELNAISQKIENMANQKGLSPQVVDDFFARIGQDSGAYRTKEAVRQISQKALKGNAPGTSWSEILQSVTSSVVTPKMVRDIAIITGKSEKFLQGKLSGLAPLARKAFLNSLVNNK